jgi:hypothetical protein
MNHHSQAIIIRYNNGGRSSHAVRKLLFFVVFTSISQ